MLIAIISPGSSPRVWGILRCQRGIVFRGRFIPTRVGNTCSSRRKGAAHPVHPHACGEYGWHWPESMSSRGSSPRVWGIHFCDYSTTLLFRFIPTRVGNTQARHERQKGPAVHPHACGEYIRVRKKDLHKNGSSPRVWGILPHMRGVLGYGRFIPTRVGNTVEPKARTSCRSVHPHACGEYVILKSCMSSNFGSSPRVWGIRNY